MTPTKTEPTTNTPSTVHPVVFSHPAAEIPAVPPQLRGTPFPRFESPSTPDNS
ncbi:hypothetical protein [Goodfellowiella coeruleoviolacea]|uniref:Uncharacterized protein n=1 Tax=Goodfellowiella coeruleoviolacea TaxID=334858 RepID=A0AAE3GIH6_9PSEU|nr:hypothetical protein [Goodfellowiella coeruleoviolacea]MCP2168027.1 hypothetical protein [Goodfellowiella coeruleoviolacea]